MTYLVALYRWLDPASQRPSRPRRLSRGHDLLTALALGGGVGVLWAQSLIWGISR